jgi:ArsR family transcriptional regulator, arsenate/arsenite/antimonite-responsive transcriptional repressor / arsenate reductase (thioredoxin)
MTPWPDDFVRRAAMHAALGEPARLAVADALRHSDRSPKELGERLGLPTNLLAHHLDVLEHAGLIERFTSSGDKRRKYVRLVLTAETDLSPPRPTSRHTGDAATSPVLFLCSHNSARSQLAAALWTARTGATASSAGTHPASRVHRGAVAAARRAGLDLSAAQPRVIDRIDADTQVVTVCDRAHEELIPADDWWHWSVPDPVEIGTAAAFDDTVEQLDRRITTVLAAATTTISSPEGTTS